VAYIGLFISAIAIGVVYIASMSYVNIRSEKNERPMMIALCHGWKLLGFAAVFIINLFATDSDANDDNAVVELFYDIYGYCLLGSSALVILLLLFNEFKQRQGLLYNYRDCLDHDNSIANNYCKLFSKHEVIVERSVTVSAAGMWKSTENLLPRNKSYSQLWTAYLLIPKLHGSVLFHYMLMMFTFNVSHSYVANWGSRIAILMMVAGPILGAIALRFVHSAKIYAFASAAALVSFGVFIGFYSVENTVMSIGLWIFYLSMSLAAAVPDIALLEISKIRFNEGTLAVGHFVEIVTIAVLQSLQRDTHSLVSINFDYTNEYMTAIAIASIVILLVNNLVYQLHMPNTFDKSLLQIQNELLKYQKYFVFGFDNDVRAFQRTGDYASSNDNVNVFDDHTTFSRQNTNGFAANDYTEVGEKLPDPPVNKAKNFDYNNDIPRPPVIIPRVNRVSKGIQSPMYKNVQ